jgi:ADP-heptose:LPS heptosyltransferase
MRKVFLNKYFSNRLTHFEKYYQWKPALWPKKTVVVIKTDAIGDYVIFRKSFDALRQSKKYRNYRFLLVGNAMWQELATNYHKGDRINFAFIDKKQFKNEANAQYRINQLLSINQKTYHTLIYWAFSRETLCGDWIAQHITAKNKIAVNGDLQCQKAPERQAGNLIYNTLIEPLPELLFEPLRNQWLAKYLTEEEVEFNTNQTNKKQTTRYVVLMPGASDAFRRWPAENFAMVCAYIVSTFDLPIILAGAPYEEELGRAIMSALTDTNCVDNKIGKLSLTELEDCIKHAKLLIGNESAGIHIAVAHGVSAICISNANHYGRFNPYELFGYSNIYTVYPRHVATLSHEERLAKYYEGSKEEISSIKVDDVLHVVNTLLKV